jgi:selenocysteine-specific elongation factor
VRSLQTHGAKTAQAEAGQRVAINLSAVSQDGIERGDAVCTKGAFLPTDCISAHLEVLPSSPQPLCHWQRVRLHVGTVDVVARIGLLRLGAEERAKGYPPGTGGPVQLLTESKITVAAGQRFVIRFYSPLLTIGGGRIMLPNGLPVRGKTDRAAKAALVEELASDFGPVSLLAALVRDRGALSISSLFALSQMDKNIFTEYADKLSCESEAYGLLTFGKAQNFISQGAFDAAAGKVEKTLEKFHAASPELTGLDAEKLAAAIEGAYFSGGLSAGESKDLLSLMAARNIIAAADTTGKPCYRLPGFERAVDGKITALVSRVNGALFEAGFNLLKAPELEAKLAVPQGSLKRALAFLREERKLWTLEGELLFSAEVRDKLLLLLASMRDDITVAALRDAAGVNRKLALSMLDFLDTQGITRRDGDRRSLVDNGVSPKTL